MKNPEQSLSRFREVANQWLNALDGYSADELLRQPTPDEWSIGQVYVHLVNSARGFHLSQVAICAGMDTDADQPKAMPGRIAYFLGSIPPVRVKVPPSPQYTPPQPESAAALRDAIQDTIRKMEEMANTLTTKPVGKGKTKHPAFGYLDAYEWFRLIEMHYRHHLRQKSRLDTFLKK